MIKISREDLLTICDFFHKLEAEGMDLPEEIEYLWERITVCIETDNKNEQNGTSNKGVR